MKNDNLLDIISKPSSDRSLEERLTLLEKQVKDLEKDNFVLRVSLDGAMNYARSIEKQFQEYDEMIHFSYRFINRNYTKFNFK